MTHGRFVELACVLAAAVEENLEIDNEEYQKRDTCEAFGKMMLALTRAYSRLDREADMNWEDICHEYLTPDDVSTVGVEYSIMTLSLSAK